MTQSTLAMPVAATPSVPALSKAGSGAHRSLANNLKRYEATRNCKILLIDDEEFNVLVVRQHLANAGYINVVSTSDPSSALEMIRREKPDLLLLDIVMPEISGLDILHVLSLNESLNHIPVLILTATSDVEVRSVCLELGVSDFLAKPVDPTDLLPRVRNALENKLYRDRMANHANQLEEQVRKRTEQLARSRQEVVQCLARAAEFRDDDTGQHVVRVGRYVGVIAEHLGFQKEQIEMLEMAAQLHDVGKIAIPDAVLHKPGKLDPQEFSLMQKHCGYAMQIIAPIGDKEAAVLRSHSRLGASLLNVSSSPLLLLASRIAQTHHERWDGSGYPLGLKGNDIPIEGRMTAVADVYDALSSRRPYKEPFPREKCFAILEEGRGKHFDPKVLDAFFARSADIIRIQLECMDSE